MFHLVFDIGNTFVKIALFEQRQLLEVFPQEKAHDLEKWFKRFDVQKSIVADVSGKHENMLETWQKKYGTKIFSAQSPIPLKNLYKTPRTLGMDRLAAAVGAFAESATDTLIIDAGTCITYDFVSRNGEFVGGNIAAGLRMRLAALPHFTGKLPLVELPDSIPEVGQSTTEAIAAGAFWGMIREIEGTIAFFQKKYPKLRVLCSGGDAKVLSEKIKSPVILRPHLVLYGLNELLFHQ